MKRFVPPAVMMILVLAVSAKVRGQFMTVELDRPYLASSVTAIVVDPVGSPVAGASVTRMSAGWKKAIESRQTNENGQFRFKRGAPTLYYLEISHQGFQIMHVKLRIIRRTMKSPRIKLEIAT